MPSSRHLAPLRPPRAEWLHPAPLAVGLRIGGEALGGRARQGLAQGAEGLLGVLRRLRPLRALLAAGVPPRAFDPRVDELRQRARPVRSEIVPGLPSQLL